jgi:hypothetical protein
MSYRPATFISRRNRSLFLSLLACFAALISVQPTFAATVVVKRPSEASLVAQTFLAEKLWLWQKRLNLTVWHIQIKLTRASELRPRTLGNIKWDATSHTAEIHVLAAEDYKLSEHDMLADMEFTVVHELVHLQLSSLPRSEASRSAEEHAVNQIAQALLNLDRR